MIRVATMVGPPVIALGLLVLATMSVYWWRDDTSGSCFRPVVALSLDTSSFGLILEEDLDSIWSDKAHAWKPECLDSLHLFKHFCFYWMTAMG